MKKFNAGKYVLHKGYKTFVPSFINEGFDWATPELIMLMEKASYYLPKLDSDYYLASDTNFFIKMYATKEATTSNRIEGTRTTLDEAIAPVESISPERRDDWQEVQNYIEAMNFAVEKLKEIPLSMRLLKETHKILLKGVRGKHKAPGEIRKTQNWIGGSSLKDAYFIPPEPNLLPDLLSDLEKFLNNENLQIPALIKAGIAHYQFETIHPFLDGNGRIGRLLIILYLVQSNFFKKPLFYISDFFERNRSSYYDALDLVKRSNNIEHWLKFFLNGIIETSKHSIETLNKIEALKKQIEMELKLLPRKSKKREALLNYLYSKPILTVKDVAKELKVSVVTANELIELFADLGILQEKTGFKRNRYFIFEDYLKIFR